MTHKWHTDMQNKSTLHLYREGKLAMGYEECYHNSYSSEFLAKARTNSLKLREWYGRGTNGKGDTKCPLCTCDMEDIIHFLIECPQLKQYRDNNIMSKVQNLSSKEKTINILFKLKNNWVEIGKMIQKMWKKRCQMVEELTIKT